MVVVEVACTRTYTRLQAAKAHFERQTDKNFFDRLRSELSGSLLSICMNLFTTPRGIHGGFDAGDIATRLYEAGAARLGTNEKVFVQYFTACSLPQLQQVAAAYETKYRCSLEAAVKSEFSGDVEDCLLFLMNDPIDIYCRRLKKAMKGLGTDERTINRIIGGNDKRTTKAIAARYLLKYNTDLCVELKKEISGDYLNAVITYITSTDLTDGAEENALKVAEDQRVAAELEVERLARVNGEAVAAAEAARRAGRAQLEEQERNVAVARRLGQGRSPEV